MSKKDRQLTAKQMVDFAIDYRDQGRHKRAIALLKEAKEVLHYLPAKTILGTTLAMTGNIDKAEDLFKKIITEHSGTNDYPLVEVYANLGSLYYNHRDDLDTALQYYDLALNAPKPKDAGIDDNSYALMVSDVYRDLCLIHFSLESFQLAKEYAKQRLLVVNDCPVSARVYGCSLFFELLERGINLDSDEQNTDLEEVAKHLQIAIENNPTDYACLAYCASALLFMRQMQYYLNSPHIEPMKRKEQEYVARLKRDSDKSVDAKAAYIIYQDFLPQTS